MKNAIFFRSAGTNDFVINYFTLPIRRKTEDKLLFGTRKRKKRTEDKLLFCSMKQQLPGVDAKLQKIADSTKLSYEVNSRGIEIFCKSWLPEASKPKATVFFCDGYGDICTFFFEGMFLQLKHVMGLFSGIARKIALAGYGVFAMDYPGFGLSQGLHGYIPSFDGLVDDVIEHYSKIKVMLNSRKFKDDIKRNECQLMETMMCSNPKGNINIAELRKAAETHKDNLSALMIKFASYILILFYECTYGLDYTSVLFSFKGKWMIVGSMSTMMNSVLNITTRVHISCYPKTLRILAA
ncbi:hypothetical protein AHAS_Ahas03G0106700 [Arachis hypogaea]